jgi:S1-C subfamily serine protease
VTNVDVVALLFVAVTALLGLRKGLIAAALSLAGVVAGAVIGARLAPHLLRNGAASPWTPLAGLAGAAFGAVVLETLGTLAGGRARRALRFRPLQSLDSAGGLALGVGVGLALVWVLGASALLVPGQMSLRRAAQKSVVLQHLYDAVPPNKFMRLLARVDPFPSIAGPSAHIAPPDPGVPRAAAVRRAETSVVRILGTACGLRISGSGWVVRRGFVVTAAHVVAGEKDTSVEPPTSNGEIAAAVVAFDARNDLAVLHVPGLMLPALTIADPHAGRAVAIVGYPENGPLTSVPGRLGPTVGVLSENAYGHGPVTRTITSVRGSVRHGDSGGPTIDTRGAVETTVFAARVGSPGGFAVPSTLVRKLLRHAGTHAVSTGGCAD